MLRQLAHQAAIAGLGPTLPRSLSWALPRKALGVGQEQGGAAPGCGAVVQTRNECCWRALGSGPVSVA